MRPTSTWLGGGPDRGTTAGMRTATPRGGGAAGLGRAALAIGLAGALALACASRPRRLEPPDVHLAYLVPVSASVFEQEVRADLRIRNPNDVDLEIDGMRLELDVNGERLGTALGNRRVRVPRLGDAQTSVVLVTTLSSLVRQIGLISVRDPAHGLEYRIAGEVFLHRPFDAELPFERTGRIGGRSDDGDPFWGRD